MSDLEKGNRQASSVEAELNRFRHREDQFAALTNDLNNLLAAMKGQAQLACDDACGQEKDELVRVVLSATLKAESLLQRYSATPEALELVADQDFDLAFLDIQLGDMKGTEVFEELHKKSPGTHVIFASGDPNMEEMAEGVTAGHRHVPAIFIRKPFDVNEVKQRISYILTMKAALR
jgi:CheY-like chemotaxis protein